MIRPEVHGDSAAQLEINPGNLSLKELAVLLISFCSRVIEPSPRPSLALRNLS